MLKYKINIMDALREKGVTAYSCRTSGVLAQSTITKINGGDTMISPKALDQICGILRCQPGDLIEWVPDEE